MRGYLVDDYVTRCREYNLGHWSNTTICVVMTPPPCLSVVGSFGLELRNCYMGLRGVDVVCSAIFEISVK